MTGTTPLTLLFITLALLDFMNSSSLLYIIPSWKLRVGRGVELGIIQNGRGWKGPLWVI